MRFSLVAGQRVTGKGDKLFFCPACHYECQADFDASVNVLLLVLQEYVLTHMFSRTAPQVITPGQNTRFPVLLLRTKTTIMYVINFLGLQPEFHFDISGKETECG
jgi:hypothetical protein